MRRLPIPLVPAALALLLGGAGCGSSTQPPAEVAPPPTSAPVAPDTEIDTAELPRPTPSTSGARPAASEVATATPPASSGAPPAPPAAPPARSPSASDGASPGADGPPELAPSEPFTTVDVTLAGPDGASAELAAYVADNPEERGRGLMDRDELPADAGMIFRFPSSTSGAFYMYRTRIPLSIAFYDDTGTVVAVLDMEPCPAEQAGDCPLYRPGASYTGALEVNQGTFDRLGLTEGWTVTLPPDLPPPL